MSRIVEMMIWAHICDFIHRTRTSNRIGIKTGGKADALTGKAGRRLILVLNLSETLTRVTEWPRWSQGLSKEQVSDEPAQLRATLNPQDLGSNVSSTC